MSAEAEQYGAEVNGTNGSECAMKLRQQGAIVEWFSAESHGDTKECTFSSPPVHAKQPISPINTNKTKGEGPMCDLHCFGLHGTALRTTGVVSVVDCDPVTVLVFRRLGWQAQLLELIIPRGSRGALLLLMLHTDPAS